MADDARTPKANRADDVQVLALAEAQLAALGTDFDQPALQDLRSVADSYPDDGHDGAGEVAASLCRLLDNLIAAGRLDREALRVHVRAWRFMVTAKPDAAARAAVLEGLSAVADLYADAKAA